MSRSTAPNGLEAKGTALWCSVLEVYELETHEELLLEQACRTVDLLHNLATTVADEGHMTAERVHPAVVEMRQQRIALARLLAALRLPAGEDGDVQAGARRPQRRVGARGVYGLVS